MGRVRDSESPIIEARFGAGDELARGEGAWGREVAMGKYLLDKALGVGHIGEKR
jgi:hypothetical protein